MFACCAKKPKEVAVVGAPFAVEALPHADTKRRASKPAKGMGSAKGMGNDLNSEKTTTLINSILTVTLKVDIIDAIEAMKREPMDVGKGYKLSVLSGMVDGPPEVIACKTAGLPDRGEATGYVFAFEANVIFSQDTTTSEEPLILKLETSNWWEPNIYLTVRDYKVDCNMHIENSPGLGYTMYYFLKPPKISWDVDCVLSEYKFDFFGENLIPKYILQPMLAKINRKNPSVVKTEGLMVRFNPERCERLRDEALLLALGPKKGCF